MPGRDVMKWRKRVKRDLINAMGGKCIKCGYSTCKAAMHFHHVNPALKEHTIARLLTNPMRWGIIRNEAMKCVLLCNRCHSELHAGLWYLHDIEWSYPKFIEKQPKVQERDCPECGKAFQTRYGKFCSLKCAAIHRGRMEEKIDWPDRVTLESMLVASSRTDVARRLGVSDAAVRKREKKLGISLSRRRGPIPIPR